jgi:hypothetical protein
MDLKLLAQYRLQDHQMKVTDSIELSSNYGFRVVCIAFSRSFGSSKTLTWLKTLTQRVDSGCLSSVSTISTVVTVAMWVNGTNHTYYFRYECLPCVHVWDKVTVTLWKRKGNSPKSFTVDRTVNIMLIFSAGLMTMSA